MNELLCITKTILIEIKTTAKLEASNHKPGLNSIYQNQCWYTTRQCSSFMHPCLQEVNTVALSHKKERVKTTNSIFYSK